MKKGGESQMAMIRKGIIVSTTTYRQFYRNNPSNKTS